MKRIYLLPFLFCFSFNSFADHSLADAMTENRTLAQKVTNVMNKYRVTCDLEFSNQTLLDPAIEAHFGPGFKQIALCFRQETDLKAARTQLQQGSKFGFYGLNGLVGVLVASYTFQNYRPEEVISVSYR